MKISYKDYLEIDKKKIDLSDFIDFIVEGIADIPILGNTIKATSSKISDIILERNSISNSIEETEDINYFITSAEDVYEEMAIKIFEILNIERIKEKYKYNIDAVELELSDTFGRNSEKTEEHYMVIRFLDQKYYNTAIDKEDYRALIICFQEEFKQINFEDNKVYICFNIVASGSNTAIEDFSKEYDELVRIVCYLLNVKL